MKVREQERRQGRRLLRDTILEAARDLFVTEGYDNVSMRKIARRIHYSPTTIYLHFQNKRALLDCLTGEFLQKLVSAMSRIVSEGLTPLRALRRWLEEYIDLGLDNPTLYRITFMLEADLWPRTEDHLPEGSVDRELYEQFLGLVRACLAQRPIDQQDLETAAQSVWAAAHGLVSLLILYPTFPWSHRDELKRRVIAGAVGGLARDRDAPCSG